MGASEYLELHQPQFSKNARYRKRESTHDLGVRGGRLVPKLRQIQPAVEKEEAAACDDLFNFRSVALRPVVVLA